MQRVATVSAGSPRMGSGASPSHPHLSDAASSAAGSLSALSGPARVTFSNMVSVSVNSSHKNSSGSSVPTSPRWGGSQSNNSTVATTSSGGVGVGGVGGLLRNSSDGIPSLERMSSLDSLGGGSLDSNGAPSLGVPPIMPALSRNHSLSLPHSARNLPPSIQRVASDASISSVEGLARVPTMLRLPSEPTIDPDQPLTISRAVSMDPNYYGAVYVESPGPAGRLLPGNLSMDAVMQQQHVQQQQQQFQHHVQQQQQQQQQQSQHQWSQRSPEDMLVSLRTPRTPRGGGYSNVNIASATSADTAARGASAAKPAKRKANGANKKKKGSFVCDFTDPATKARCGQSFDRKAALTAHRRERHSGERVYKCKVAGCNKTFATASNRTAHQRSTAHTSERKYKCDFVDPKTGEKCTNAYTHSRSLIEHKCKHTGTWLHQCKDCGKKFTVNSNFKRHRDKVDCKAKLEKKRLREAKEQEKKARQAARASAKAAAAAAAAGSSSSSSSGGGGGGDAGGDAKRSRRSQAI